MLMITSKELEEMKKIDPLTVNLDDLIDIKDVEIRTNLPQEERIVDFISQIKNPYLFKCGDTVVECVFSQTQTTLLDRLKQLMRTV